MSELIERLNGNNVMGVSKIVRKPLSKTEPVSKKQIRTTPVQAEVPRMPDLSLIGRQPLDPHQIMHLQRTIGNAATNRLLGNIPNNPQGVGDLKSDPASPIIQRFPTSAELKARGDAASNETGLVKKTSQKFSSKKKSRYDTIVDGADDYNALVKAKAVEGAMGDRLASYKRYSQALEDLRQQTQDYINKHTKKGDRAKTVTSFTTLLTEIELEKKTLLEVYNDQQFTNQQNNPAWQTAVSNKIMGRDAGIVPLSADIGLSVDYLKSLSPKALASINAVHRFLAQGKLADAQIAMEKMKGELPEKTFLLIRSSLMRKHLDKINPELNKVITDRDFKQKPGMGNAWLGNVDLKIGENNNDNAQHYLKNFKGPGNLAANDAKIDTAADHDEGVKREVRTKEEFTRQFKERQMWESENVKESDYRKLQPFEQGAIAAFSLDYKEFSSPLRGDLTPGENEGQFKHSNQAITENLISALNKLPPYTEMVFRHDGDFPGFLDYNRDGATVSDMAFYSTTREAATLRKVDGSPTPDILTIIKSKTGRFIKPMSSYNTVGSKVTHDENEVLFKPGTKFKITNSYHATQTAQGTLIFAHMPDWIQNILNQDSEKATIRHILLKEEVG